MHHNTEMPHRVTIPIVHIGDDIKVAVECFQNKTTPKSCYKPCFKQLQSFGSCVVSSAAHNVDQARFPFSNGPINNVHINAISVKDGSVNDTALNTKCQNVGALGSPIKQPARSVSRGHCGTLLLATYSDISSDDECESSTDETDGKLLSKKRRKSATPRRSADKADPQFKGATVWIQTSYRNGKSRLAISAFYSNVKFGANPSQRPRLGSVGHSSSPEFCSQSETDEIISPSDGKETYLLDCRGPNKSIIAAKACASCRTRRTPLWRDAEDGTPLCNACGIRYKKYRLRCSKCWHIPKKEIKTYPNCPACGASLKYTFHRRTW